MSEVSHFSIVPRVVWQECQPRDIKVYCALASYVNWETGVCWPSRSTIAETLGISVSTVDRALKALESAGVIEIDKRKTEQGDHDSNLYRLPFAINSRFAEGGRRSEATWPQNSRQGSGRTDSGTRAIEQQGLTPKKTKPEYCAHVPIDDLGYCTACGTTLKEDSK